MRKSDLQAVYLTSRLNLTLHFIRPQSHALTANPPATDSTPSSSAFFTVTVLTFVLAPISDTHFFALYSSLPFHHQRRVSSFTSPPFTSDTSFSSYLPRAIGAPLLHLASKQKYTLIFNLPTPITSKSSHQHHHVPTITALPSRHYHRGNISSSSSSNNHNNNDEINVNHVARDDRSKAAATDSTQNTS